MGDSRQTPAIRTSFADRQYAVRCNGELGRDRRLARRTGRFPQLVDPRSGVNALLMDSFAKVSRGESRERRRLSRLNSLRPLTPTLPPRVTTVEAIGCSVGVLRLDSSRLLTREPPVMITMIPTAKPP